ncbi:hypothetical protein P153DRAFT_364671 [Dothidotthia symphoricarpi CBS 119687]|uniref:Uncharacterized protein n=1 Tax=Dothidotthia symphoricarpi CBS 119687 TaxID=1392245 RepID=A0A6A6AM50_9PLEO|nr:uncharacterized protein P153DRAFT_364671 [Dothidotthia symphoricarpi CBS 119687]KAF2132243.1 hypothetical protein P153DRAFT_364671 [Dothidotthia symphoricarpi CBS 119687]
MQDWESRKIDYDLYYSSVPEPKKPNTNVDAIVPLGYVLRNRDDGHYFESGSRFRLPVVDTDGFAAINGIGTLEKLRKVVDDFNQGSKSQKAIKNHGLRVFLEKFEIAPTVNEEHESPTSIRQAVNTTPTKSRPARGSISKHSTTHSTTQEVLEKQNPPNSPTNIYSPEQALETPKRPSATARRIQRVVAASYGVDQDTNTPLHITSHSKRKRTSDSDSDADSNEHTPNPKATKLIGEKHADLLPSQGLDPGPQSSATALAASELLVKTKTPARRTGRKRGKKIAKEVVD